MSTIAQSRVSFVIGPPQENGFTPDELNCFCLNVSYHYPSKESSSGAWDKSDDVFPMKALTLSLPQQIQDLSACIFQFDSDAERAHCIGQSQTFELQEGKSYLILLTKCNSSRYNFAATFSEFSNKKVSNS